MVSLRSKSCQNISKWQNSKSQPASPGGSSSPPSSASGKPRMVWNFKHRLAAGSVPPGDSSSRNPKSRIIACAA